MLFIFLAGILSTCKKYPEGPLISLRTKVQRLTGTWKVEKYLIDGADSTAIKYPVECSYRITNKEHTTQIFDRCGSSQSQSEWDFNENRTSLIFKSSGSPLFLTKPIEWKIMKLKFKEMHLQTEYNSKQYDAYLTKIK